MGPPAALHRGGQLANCEKQPDIPWVAPHAGATGSHVQMPRRGEGGVDLFMVVLGLICTAIVGSIFSGIGIVMGIIKGPYMLGWFMIAFPIAAVFAFACLPNPCRKSEKMKKMPFN